MQKIASIAAAGALGTVVRYGIAEVVNRVSNPSFPLGTLAVNAIGCLIVGFLLALFENRLTVTSETKTLILVGFMGAFTTFSAFALETSEFLRTANYFHATGNILLQNFLGIAMLFAGFFIGRMI